MYRDDDRSRPIWADLRDLDHIPPTPSLVLVAMLTDVGARRILDTPLVDPAVISVSVSDSRFICVSGRRQALALGPYPPAPYPPVDVTIV